MATDLRLLSAQLLSEVSDKVSSDLGYRYFRVFVPGLFPPTGEIIPRPRVKDVTGKQYPEASYARWLDAVEVMPSKLYEIRLPKVVQGVHITESSLRAILSWTMINESNETVYVKPLEVITKNAFFTVVVALIKG